MNKHLYILLLALVSVFNVTAQSRQIFTVNNNWKFFKGDIEASESAVIQEYPQESDEKWQTINLPHTWNNLDAIDDIPGYYRGVGWYKKSIYMEGRGERPAQTLIYFEGANQVTDVYVNGQWVGQHKGGYTRFHFDITPFLKYNQDNVLAIKVDNSHNKDIPPLSADFSFFGGIYRDVFLIKLNDVHFSMDDFSSSGVYITTPNVSKEQAKVQIECLLTNGTNRNRAVDLSARVIDKEGNTISRVYRKKRLGKNERKISISEEIIMENPHLWSPDNPYLYNIIVQLKDAGSGQILDESVQPLGLRWSRFDPKEGFFLNGEYLKLIGTNRHQDYLQKGNALPDEMHVRDIRLLKDMGGNFLRISHYPQDPTVLEMCDKLGILTSVEIPIVNAITESEEFTKNSIFMAEEMVKQNFNHPSLIIWAYMNEVLLRLPFDQKTEKERYGVYAKNVTELATEIENHIRELDPHRYTMIPNHGAISRYKDAGLTDVPMILGWNLYQGWYSGKLSGFDKNLDKLHSLFPNQPLIITEYGADVHPRLHSLTPERFDYTVEYGNEYHEHYLKAIMNRPYIVGANIWNLNDFYSEYRGYAMPRTNLKGITTLNREKKDTWWLYKTFLSSTPVIKFGQNEWKIRGGVAEPGKDYCIQPITVYSNGDVVELRHNDEVYSAKVVDNIARFSVPFVNGENKFVAQSKINSKVYTDVMEVDFRLAPYKFFQFNSEFQELNVLLGTNRIYEDKVNDVVWIPEQAYVPGGWGYVGGEPFRPKTKYGSLPSSELDIVDSENDPIYQTQRVGLKKFKFDVPEGKYTIALGWAELQSDIEHEKLVYNLGNDKIEEAVSDRIFNVLVNGDYIEKNLNITEQFGAERAVLKKYTIVVTDKEGISIDFEAVTGNPILNTIQIRRL